jgi:hypothetical protein
MATKTTQTIKVKKTTRRSSDGKGDKRTWKVTEEGKQFIIAASINGASLREISKMYAKEFGKTLSIEAIRHHLFANREKITTERQNALERARLQYPYAGFEGRVKKNTEMIEKIENTRKSTIAKYKAIADILKIIGQEEIALRQLILKEVAAGVGEEETTWELELKQVLEELSEENIQIAELGKIAGW